MNDFSSEENKELVETLKGPRYYRVTVSGYGGEASYMAISKEAHDFWKAHTEEHGDGDICHYMTGAEECDLEFDEISELPESAQFMKDEDGDNRPWYEPPNQIDHTYGGTYDSCYISVDEVDSDDYSANVIREVIDREDLSELVDRVYEDSGEEYIEINEYSCCDEPGEDVKYIAQMYSSEKGCFFDGVIETVGSFDPKKLKLHVVEYLNGEDTLTSIEYDGVEVDNNGGDTNGKGYYGAVWEV